MSTNPTNFNLLSRIAALVGLLSASLYFTGWIYRWAYFGFFHLEVTTLDLAFESFLIVPLQVFLVNWPRFIVAILILLLSPLAFWIILGLFQWFDKSFVRFQKRWRLRLIQWRQQSWLNRVQIFNPQVEAFREILLQWSPKPVDFANTLVDEAIKVALVLTALFWLASSQGLADAQRDAFNQTSTLPAIAFIFPENLLSLGKQFDPPEALANKQPANQFRMLGDRGLLEALRCASELNDLKNQRVNQTPFGVIQSRSA